MLERVQQKAQRVFAALAEASADDREIDDRLGRLLMWQLRVGNVALAAALLEARQTSE